jgi:CBS domain-containing protein
MLQWTLMLNSDRFLDAFYTIEKYVRRASGADSTDTFTGSVHRSAKADPRVQRYKNTLIEFAQLRNAIVHGPRGDRVLAEPNEEVVAQIEQIARLLTAPPRVTEFMKRNVVTLQADEPLRRALTTFRDSTFSQIPVYRGKQFAGLLTTTALVRWLAEHLENEAISVDQARVADALPGGEPRHRFLSAKASAFDVLDAFERYQRQGKRLRAVLITQNGQPNEGLLGILTAWDLTAIYDALEGPGEPLGEPNDGR